MFLNRRGFAYGISWPEAEFSGVRAYTPEKGLRQLANLPPTPARLHRELELQVARGRALMEQRGAGDEEVRTTFERAHDLCLVLGGTKLLLHTHDGLANYHLAHSELDKVAEHAETALELGFRTGDHHAVVLAHRSRGHARLMVGRFHDARDDLRQAIEKYEGEMAITRDPKVSSCGALGICLTALGLPESGTSMSFAAIHHAEVLQHPISLNLALRRACVQGMMRRDAQQVLELSARLLDNQSDYETFRGSREGVFFSTWARSQLTSDPGMREQLRAILDEFESARYLNFLPFFMLSAAELVASQGDPEGATGLLSRAAALVEETNERWCQAEISRLQARLASDAAETARLLEAGLSLSRTQGALLWELRATMDFAQLLKHQGEREAAHRTLAPVLARMTEGAAMLDVRASRELLHELSSAASAVGPSALEKQHA